MPDIFDQVTTGDVFDDVGAKGPKELFRLRQEAIRRRLTAAGGVPTSKNSKIDVKATGMPSVAEAGVAALKGALALVPGIMPEDPNTAAASMAMEVGRRAGKAMVDFPNDPVRRTAQAALPMVPVLGGAIADAAQPSLVATNRQPTKAERLDAVSGVVTLGAAAAPRSTVGGKPVGVAAREGVQSMGTRLRQSAREGYRASFRPKSDVIADKTIPRMMDERVKPGDDLSARIEPAGAAVRDAIATKGDVPQDVRVVLVELERMKNEFRADNGAPINQRAITYIANEQKKLMSMAARNGRNADTSTANLVKFRAFHDELAASGGAFEQSGLPPAKAAALSKRIADATRDQINRVPEIGRANAEHAYLLNAQKLASEAKKPTTADMVGAAMDGTRAAGAIAGGKVGSAVASGVRAVTRFPRVKANWNLAKDSVGAALGGRYPEGQSAPFSPTLAAEANRVNGSRALPPANGAAEPGQLREAPSDYANRPRTNHVGVGASEPYDQRLGNSLRDHIRTAGSEGSVIREAELIPESATISDIPRAPKLLPPVPRQLPPSDVVAGDGFVMRPTSERREVQMGSPGELEFSSGYSLKYGRYLNENDAILRMGQVYRPERLLPEHLRNARSVEIGSPLSGKIKPRAVEGVKDLFGNPVDAAPAGWTVAALHGEPLAAGRTSNAVQVARSQGYEISEKGNRLPREADANYPLHEYGHAVFDRDLDAAVKAKWQAIHNRYLAMKAADPLTTRMNAIMNESASLSAGEDEVMGVTQNAQRKEALRAEYQQLNHQRQVPIPGAILFYAEQPWHSFAPLFASYIANPTQLKARYPDVYDFMKTDVFRGKEYIPAKTPQPKVNAPGALHVRDSIHEFPLDPDRERIFIDRSDPKKPVLRDVRMLFPDGFSGPPNVTYGPSFDSEKTGKRGVYGFDLETMTVNKNSPKNTIMIAKQAALSPADWIHEHGHSVDLTGGLSDDLRSAFRNRFLQHASAFKARMESPGAPSWQSVEDQINGKSPYALGAPKAIIRYYLDHANDPQRLPQEDAVREAFAELFSQFYANPKMFKQKYPEDYELMRTIVSSGQRQH